MSSHRAASQPVNVAELKAHFSDYLDRVSKGERVVVRRRNRDVAVLVPIDDAARDAGSAPFKGLGLIAAAGAWAAHEDIDQFVADVYAARRRTRDRKVPPLE